MNILRAFFSLSSLTLLSRVSGFVKVALFASYYGRSPEADMFLAVMILPDLLYRFLSEGLISSAAVPMFVEVSEDEKRQKKALATVLSLGFWLSLVFALIMMIFAEDFCRMLTPGFNKGLLERMKWLWRLVSLYLVTGILSGVLTSFFNARNIFALPALGPLIVNLVIIIGTVIAAGGAVEKIVVAVVLGSLLQLLWLFYLLGYYRFSLRGIIGGFDLAVAKDFLKSVFPVAAWISVLPFIPVYERYLLSLQPVGSVAALNYIEKLFNLPLGILSISLARVVLPELSRLQGKVRQNFLLKTLGIATLVVLPVVALTVLLAEPVVEIVFKRGQFSLADAKVAAGLFRSYAYALLPTTLCMILNRGFFASRRYLIPFIAGLAAAASQFWLGRQLVADYGVNGIGYAAAAAFSVQLLVLLIAELRSVHKLT